ncbi:MAG: glycosyltransferase [Burkholderiaceae bacterium]|jgi:glycosyltransferase involved in cell wall biosynthesis|nr:glycosyltransferase [Burkholderiaceae bacterium]
MTPTRVLHVITGLSTGGAELSLLKLVGSLRRERFDHLVVSLTGKGDVGDRIEALGVPVIAMRLSRAVAAVAGPTRLSRIIAKAEPSFVQGWMYHANLLATMAVKLAGIGVPVLWNVRASLDGIENEKRSTRALVRVGAWISSSPQGIIYNSVASARQHEALGYAAGRTQVIPNGFDCSLFRPNPSAGPALREALGLDAHSIVVGCVGRYHPMKDHATLLSAAASAVRIEPRLQFVLVGAGVDSSNHALAALVAQLGLAANVHCLGERGDIPAITAALDIACSASCGESFPNVVGEAMACGVPCVVTDTGDAARVVAECGLVVPVREPALLGKAIVSMVRLGADRRRSLGSAARERITRHFSLEAVSDCYQSYYERISPSRAS